MHIGQTILKKLKERGISNAELARRIHYTRQNVTTIFERESIDTELLSSIGKALDYNFFELFVKHDVNEKLTSKKPKITLQIELDDDTEMKILNKQVYNKIIEILK